MAELLTNSILNNIFDESTNSLRVSAEKVGAFAYISVPAPTTITVGDTYYEIQGAYVQPVAENFQENATYDAIQYIGTQTCWFEIDWSASVYGNSNGITAHIGIKKNGTLSDASVMGTFLKTSNEAQAMAGTDIIELSTNDEIQMCVTADTSGDIITVKHFTTSIRRFFK